ncbi:MAG TPA: type II toxin-antitoxin system VapB family antitoxin [Nitrospirales bacterium]|nr:type II toxin-antitoxin system VapB family antitoxin [Nitrospirales bacterium]
MALSIKNPKAEQLAGEVSRETGETMTQAVIHALEERLERLRGRKAGRDLADVIMDISRRCSSLPDVDARSPKQILGYNATGTFS